MKNLKKLWNQFIPLSISDMNMACIDPMIFFTLAHMPNTKENIAAIGIAKAIAVLFESPIIMILQTSTTLAKSHKARNALFKFMLLLAGALSFLLAILCIPDNFHTVVVKIMSIPKELIKSSQMAITIIILWPMIIAWRRYYQGLLIHYSKQKYIAMAGFFRVIVVAIILAIGHYSKIHPITLASFALIFAAFIESLIITFVAYKNKKNFIAILDIDDTQLPTSISSIAKFYWPLANSLLFIWGGRLILVALISRSVNAAIALAIWASAWGLIIVISNGTRMIQQIIISQQNKIENSILFQFAFSVGLVFSAILFFIGYTSWGNSIVSKITGADSVLSVQSIKVIKACILIPFLTTLQNVFQGFLMTKTKTKIINYISWLGTFSLITIVFVLIKNNSAGEFAACIGINIALIFEIILLKFAYRTHCRASLH